MEIREIKEIEQEMALKLVWETFLKFEAPDYNEDGIREFKNSINDPNFIAKIKLYGAFVDECLVGVLGIRNLHHLALLFIDAKYQRNGIGTKLFEFAVSINPDSSFTVNSSPYAHDFYKKLGFVGDEKICIKGIKFYPMKLKKQQKDWG